MDFAVPADNRVKLKKSEKRDKYLDLARELKKKWSMKDSNCDWFAQYSQQLIGKGTRRLGNKRMSGDHPNNSIVEIGQNTKKSPGDLRGLVVAQTPPANAGVKNSQMSKISDEVINFIEKTMKT